MRTAKQMSPTALLILAVCASVAWANEATAARLIRAKILLDGNTLLEGSTSDNGRVDADGVWEYLKSVKFKATQHFIDLKVDPSAKGTTVSSNARPGKQGTIVVDIAYGGMAFTRKLKLVRLPIDRQGREWSLDPTEIDKMFDDRFIRRSQAARLDNPRRSKR